FTAPRKDPRPPRDDGPGSRPELHRRGIANVQSSARQDLRGLGCHSSEADGPSEVAGPAWHDPLGLGHAGQRNPTQKLPGVANRIEAGLELLGTLERGTEGHQTFAIMDDVDQSLTN